MGKFIDETGNRHGRWTVIERAGRDRWGQSLWLCHCDCGNEGIIPGGNLRHGASKSCGCLQRDRTSEAHLIDLTGQKFGRLFVIRREGSKRGHAAWLCRCNCGGMSIVSACDLQDGHTKSCGCLQGRRPHLLEGESAFKALVSAVGQNARRHELTLSLTREQIRQLVTQPCYYCGVEPAQVFRKKMRGRVDIFVYNGIDRTDNKRGYEMDNVVPCCWQCNSAKNTLTLSEFKSWILSVYDHFINTDTTAH